MKHIIAPAAAALAFGIGAASAADLGAPAPAPIYTKAPIAPPPPSWTGCYLGGYVGGAAGSHVNTGELESAGGPYNTNANPLFSYNTNSSVIGGGTLGCNWQPTAMPFVLGIEGEAGHLHSTGSIPDPNSPGLDTVDSTKIGDWYGVVAGRFGYAAGQVLLYGKAGVAFTQVSSSVVDACTAPPCGPDTIHATGSKDTTGAALGGGIEYALTNHWSIKGEYLWLGLGDSTYNVCGTDSIAAHTFCSAHNLNNGISTGKVGVNYRF